MNNGTTYVHKCLTCMASALIAGEYDVEVTLSLLADGDAASQHKADNPTHIVVAHTTFWGGA